MYIRWGLLSGFITLGFVVPAVAQTGPARCFSIELFYDSSEHTPAGLPAELRRLAAARGGLSIYVSDIQTSEHASQRLDRIRSYFRREKLQLPAVYGLNQLGTNLQTKADVNRQLTRMLTVTAWIRSGCPHCRAAKQFLAENIVRYPGLSIKYREVTSNPEARREMQEVARHYRQAATSLPVLHFCNGVTVGFDRAATSGKRILETLDYWSRPCAKISKRDEDQDVSADVSVPRVIKAPATLHASATGIMRMVTARPAFDQGDDNSFPAAEVSPVPDVVSDSMPPPVGFDLPPPIPGDSPESQPGPSLPDNDTIDLPYVGSLRVSDVGMPLFTIAVGLVDGFNPCAMWVLLFLLSVLVNLKSRRKMFMIAGIFVLISGIAYFTFMAAWLHVYLLIGYLRSVQVILGTIGVTIGTIHIKDFFALHKGISLSIPESAKPGLYARIRGVVTADTMWAALAGVVVLAVLVNMVELLCTSGLPALYTNILTLQEYSAGVNYGYLALYNVAYMFDDGLMVLIAVVTLDRHKLQESHGRWLKLISGLVIAMLGLVMIFRPEWLV